MMYILLRYLLCGLMMLIATITDTKTKRIPNWLTFPCLGVGVSLALWFQDWTFLVWIVVACLILFVAGYFGVMGMGDIKLCMAMTAFLEFKYFLWALGAGTIIMIIVWFVKMRKAALKESKQAILALITQNYNFIDPNGSKMVYAPFLSIGFLVAVAVHCLEGIVALC